MKNRAPLLLIHVIAWVLFLSLPTLMRPLRPGEDMLSDFYHVPRLLNGALLLGVFYFNYSVAIPRFYLKGKYLYLALSGLGFFLLLVLLNGVILKNPAINPPPNFGPGPGFGPGVFGGMSGPPRPHFTVLGPSHNLFMFIIVYMASFSIRLYVQYKRTMEEKLSSEISFLKAQINPHFLFNTLNSIYSLSLTKSDATPEAVLKLSDIMRFTTGEAHQTLVLLDKEIGYINSYVDLQRLRLPARAKVSCTLEGSPLGRQIAPFILIPFVENAFKYGVNPNEDSDITIRITLGGAGRLDLLVENTKVFVKPERLDSTGLGIANTRRRLELLYPGKHDLTIDDTRDRFRVALTLNLL